MFPKERKMNIKLDKLVIEKFPVVAISTISSVLSRPQIIVSSTIWVNYRNSCDFFNLTGQKQVVSEQKHLWPDNMTGGSPLVICSPVQVFRLNSLGWSPGCCVLGQDTWLSQALSFYNTITMFIGNFRYRLYLRNDSQEKEEVVDRVLR